MTNLSALEALARKWLTEDCDDSEWMMQPVSDGIKFCAGELLAAIAQLKQGQPFEAQGKPDAQSDIQNCGADNGQGIATVESQPSAPTQAQARLDDQQFANAVLAEVKRARSLFPGANATNAALVEEVGEVSKALMYEPWDAVVIECVQVAAMACRLVTEGDSTMAEFRWNKVHAQGMRYMEKEHLMPIELEAAAKTSEAVPKEMIEWLKAKLHEYSSADPKLLKSCKTCRDRAGEIVAEGRRRNWK